MGARAIVVPGHLTRGAVLDAMGGFDEALFNYYDDVEVGVWSWRLGRPVVCAPAAWVDHGFSVSDTINRVLAGGPATQIASVSARGMAMGFRPLPRTNEKQPPWAEAHASTPDGLP